MLQAWRARALHYFLIHTCGLQSGTPSPSLERGHLRGVPETFRADRTTSSALRYIPEFSEYTAVCATKPFDGTHIKLSPLLALLCMPVQRVLLLFGAPRIVSSLFFVAVPSRVPHYSVPMLRFICCSCHILSSCCPRISHEIRFVGLRSVVSHRDNIPSNA